MKPLFVLWGEAVVSVHDCRKSAKMSMFIKCSKAWKISGIAFFHNVPRGGDGTPFLESEFKVFGRMIGEFADGTFFCCTAVGFCLSAFCVVMEVLELLLECRESNPIDSFRTSQGQFSPQCGLCESQLFGDYA